MTRPQGPREPQDLRGVFRDHEGSTVDVPGLMAGVRHRIQRRRARRRTAGIVAVGLVTALAAGIPIVASSIPDQDSGTAGGTSQSVPSDTHAPVPQPLDGPALRSTQFAFTVAERPADYTMASSSTGPGWQMLRLYVLDNVAPQRSLDVTIFDPALSGLAAPSSTGETAVVDSPSAGQLTVQFIVIEREGQQSPGVGWETDTGLWLTVTSDGGPADLARQEVLAVAAQVDLGRPYPLTFPFHLGYVPDGFDLAGGSAGEPQLESATFLSFHDLSPLSAGSEPALSISAVNQPGIPSDGAANTTIGSYQAQLTEGLYLSVFDVEGFMINVSVRADFADRISEDQLRQIAESIVVIPGAATDRSVWTEQPVA